MMPSILGLHGIVNVQGEEQQKLDVLSNTAMINILKSTQVVCFALALYLRHVKSALRLG